MALIAHFCFSSALSAYLFTDNKVKSHPAPTTTHLRPRFVVTVYVMAVMAKKSALEDFQSKLRVRVSTHFIDFVNFRAQRRYVVESQHSVFTDLTPAAVASQKVLGDNYSASVPISRCRPFLLRLLILEAQQQGLHLRMDPRTNIDVFEEFIITFPDSIYCDRFLHHRRTCPLAGVTTDSPDPSPCSSDSREDDGKPPSAPCP